MTQFTEIQVIIPTINEPSLVATVAEAKRQLPGASILLAGFGPAARVAASHQVGFLDLGRKTPKPIAINRAVQTLPGDYFIILDADVLPAPGWGAAMLQAFNAGHEFFSAAVDVTRGTVWMRAYNLSSMHEFTPEKPPGPRLHLAAYSLGFTRIFFNANGPLDETLNRSEDFEWSLRATRRGQHGIFYPQAVVWHLPESKNTLGGLVRFWFYSANDNWSVRKRYVDVLGNPVWQRSGALIIVLGPLLALGATLRIAITSPIHFFGNLHLLPLIYLTKLSWSFGILHQAQPDDLA